MKRWIHASTENIDQKIKDYLAAWAHDNVKAGEEACSLKDFRSELKDKGLKYTDSRYDYYLQCYNHMNNAKNGSSKKVNASTDTRDRITYLEDRIDRLTQYIDECKAEGCDLEEFVDEMAELQELKEQLNFAWQDDEAEYNYAVEQQEFNPDGSLKFYGSTKVTASKGWKESFDNELHKTYYTLTTPNGTASVSDFDNDGDWGYTVRIDDINRRFGDEPIRQTFKPRGNTSGAAIRLQAMAWAEKQLADLGPVNKPYQVVLRDGEIYRDNDTNDIIEINSKPIIKEVSSLDEAMKVYQKYLHDNGIRSSENTGGLVLQGDEPIAVLSYNGRHIDNFNDYIQQWGKGILYNSQVLKSLGYGIEASTSINASTLWDNGWSKRYNKEIGETYFVFTCPKATAYVFQDSDRDDNGEYNSSAEVGFTEDLFKNTVKKSFFGKGSEFDAVTWAEHVIFDGDQA